MNYNPQQSEALRDLNWAINSPSLIENCTDKLNVQADEDVLAKQLFQFMENRISHRVGYYFESLVHFYLRNMRMVEIVGQRLQIQENCRTIGELDFLFRDEQGELNHWEVAVKFYLYHPEKSVANSHFIGPNAADTFERKMKRLFEHQLPLSEKYFPEVSQRHAFVKGRIFYHPQMPLGDSLPTLLAANHLRGDWIYLRELEWLNHWEFDAATMLIKPWWLSSTRLALTDDVLTRMELRASLQVHFERSNHPQLISLLSEQSSEYIEIRRLFVVHDQWPCTA